MFDTAPFEEKMDTAVMHFEAELNKIRTGRAHPSMLESIHVEAYGQKMPLNQLANVTAPEPQLLQVTPFDPSSMTAIVSAIRDDQSLGFNPSDDGRIIRVPVPALTEERRRQYVKLASEKVEEARIQLRTIRQELLKTAKAKKDQKELSEDDVKMIEKGVDDDMKTYGSKLDELFRAKEQDILTL